MLPILFPFLALCWSFLWSVDSRAADTPYIPVGAARTKKTVIAFPNMRFVGKSDSSTATLLEETVTNDLTFMDLFRFVGKAAFIEDAAQAGIEPGSFRYSDWTTIGAEFLLKTSLRRATSEDKFSESQNTLVLEAHLFDTYGAKQVLAKRYVAPSAEAKTMAHTLANDVVQALTGLPGIFQTKLAMSCDKTGKKEIFVMNFDGTEVKQVSRHRSIAFSPAWSPDGTRIAYSLFTKHAGNIKNIDLYEYDFTTSTIRLLSNRKGINSGVAYTPDGRKIALTLSYLGNPEIFLLDLATKGVTQLTKSFGFDVDPNWSPDGSKFAFVSSRTGVPMVFSADADGKNPQRLTFAGRYNAAPSWSPQNNKIAFAGWIDKTFDIFIMNPDGTHIERLTKDQGGNEDPAFSPDGNFVAFSSNRTGQKNIYVMNVDGTFVKRLTYGLGNCVSPKWSRPAVPVSTNLQQKK